jgi:hypothetical protein
MLDLVCEWTPPSLGPQPKLNDYLILMYGKLLVMPSPEGNEGVSNES